MLASGAANAEVFNVEKSGDDNNACTNPQSACLSIGGALAKAGKNDTVLVGAGLYREALVLDQIGTKLLSRAGAGATVIDARPFQNAAGISVIAKRVRVGQRGRGFRVIGGAGGSAIHVMADASTIEGNDLEGGSELPGSFIFRAGVLGQASGTTVRYNTLRSGMVFMPVSESIAAVGNLLIADNLISSGGLNITSTLPTPSHRVQNNEFLAGSMYVLSTVPGNDFLGVFPERSNDRYSGNNFGAGSVLIQGGNPVFERNHAGSVRLDNSTNSVVRRNLVVNYGLGGNPGIMLVQDPVNVSVVQNTVVGTRPGFLLSGEDTPLRQFRNNNFLDMTLCTFDFVERSPALAPLVFSGNFYGSPGVPDLSCSRGGDELVAAGALSLRPRPQANAY